jgi:hypothetical protein
MECGDDAMRLRWNEKMSACDSALDVEIERERIYCV